MANKKVVIKSSVKEIEEWLDLNLDLFENPSAYLGDEPGSFHRKWKSATLKHLTVGARSYAELLGNWGLDCVVQMVGGMKPADVPWDARVYIC